VALKRENPSNNYYILKIKPKKAGKLTIRFVIEGKFLPYGIEESVEKGSAKINGTLVYHKEIKIF